MTTKQIIDALTDIHKDFDDWGDAQAAARIEDLLIRIEREEDEEREALLNDHVQGDAFQQMCDMQRMQANAFRAGRESI